MKRPYLVGLKIRELQKKHFEALAAKSLARCPANCKYNQPLVLGDHAVRICTAGQRPGLPVDSHKIVLCQSITQAMECRLYDPKYVTKGDVADALKAEISDPHRKRLLFPDIAALEWVLDSDLHAAVSEPRFVVRVLLKVVGLLEKAIKKAGGQEKLLSWEKKSAQTLPPPASSEEIPS